MMGEVGGLCPAASLGGQWSGEHLGLPLATTSPFHPIPGGVFGKPLIFGHELGNGAASACAILLLHSVEYIA